MNEYTFAQACATSLTHNQSPPIDGELHVWLWTASSVGDDSTTILNAEERDRCSRLATPELRRRFIASHAGLRQVLAGYLNGAANDLAFHQTPAGKPHLGDGTLRFNLSHSADVNLLAVATAEVGADIERARPVTSLASLAARHFAGLELEAMRNSDDPLHSFFQTWTRKEAVIKLVGLGLATSLQDLDTSPQGDPISVPAAWKFQKNCCWLADLATDLDHVAAVASGDKPHTVRLFRGE
ncbi:4'-phosphopantetheinyl transferase family protein [Aeoliella sp. SH292]|uniref:4'-phosphopantetheinyl transferase family protein n=1 Tax=Aeoliella sp. SH292 TaxID=3454464 RepID=UPI003F9A6E6F